MKIRRLLFLLFCSVVFCACVYAAKNTTWSIVKKVDITTTIRKVGDNNYTVNVKTFGTFESNDGGIKRLSRKYKLGGVATYSLAQIFNNYETIGGVHKTEFKTIVLSGVDENVE